MESDLKHAASDDVDDLQRTFAPFFRRDVYGPLGRGKLPWTETVLLLIAMVTLVPARVAVGLTMVAFYYTLCRICTLFEEPNREDEQEDYAHMRGWRRAAIVHSGRFLTRVFLFLLGFYWINEINISPEAPNCSSDHEAVHIEEGEDTERQEMAGAIIANHVSYIDILYHMYSSFPIFVAKKSVAKLPIVGLISKCLGCVYVDRKSKLSEFRGVSGIVAKRIREASWNRQAPMVMLFPEGTTTNGDFLLPFKTGAFLPAAPVLPMILRYPHERFSLAWESISGVRHVILLLCQFVNHMEVIQFPVYYPSRQEKDDPRLYADNVRNLMSREGKLVLSESGFAEKRIYLAALRGKSAMPSDLHLKDY